jgi:hypothetical protein
MWKFAAYEILRTWRARATDVILEKELCYVHPGRKMRANQLGQVLDDPTIIDKIKSDLKIVHIPFARIEYVRVALAKHEVRGNKSSVAYASACRRRDSVVREKRGLSSD